MARASKAAPSAPAAAAAPSRATTGLVIAALAGLFFSAWSTWVHYQILRDPLYSPSCDVGAWFSCSDAYTSRFGAIGGVPVALLGVLFFAFVLLLIALCKRADARQNLPGYVFVASTIGLAGVLYLAYASFFVLKTVCPLCLGTYVAMIALFLIAGAAARFPMSTLPGRASRDVRTLVRTPAALGVALAFVTAAVLGIMFFPSEPISASAVEPHAPSTTAAPAQAAPAPAQAMIAQLEQFLAAQQRVNIPNAGSGAAVVIYKFNDYQCPACGLTHREYKPILARLQQEYPGKIAFISRDFPLDPECNSIGGGHQAACEAAVAVRLAREKGKAVELEDWLFANQPSLTPDTVKAGARDVAGVTDFDARYTQAIPLVKADIAQGLQFQVNSTPSFFMNGIKLPNLQGPFFEAAVMWELRRLGVAK